MWNRWERCSENQALRAEAQPRRSLLILVWFLKAQCALCSQVAAAPPVELEKLYYEREGSQATGVRLN